MRPRTFCLTEAEATQLQAAFQHCPDARTKTRYQAVRLYGTGYAVAHITDICACHRTSLAEWVHAYRQHGLSALLDHRQGGNRARLTPEQIELVQTKLHRYTPSQLLGRDGCVGDGQFWTVPDVARLLEREYGVTYQSRTSYQTLLQTRLTRRCCKHVLPDVAAKLWPELSAPGQAVQVALRDQTHGLRGGARKKNWWT